MPSSKIVGRCWADATAARSKVSTWVPLTREVCFDYVADVSRHPEWATSPVEITPRAADEAGAGARYKAVARQGGKDWPADLEVTVYDQPSTFEFTATGGPVGTPDDDPVVRTGRS